MAGYRVRTLDELSAEARGYFTSSVDGAVVSVWPNTFTVTAKVLAMLGREHELRRAFLYDQLFVSTCAPDALERHAYDLGLVRGPGAPSTGAATFACAVGAVVPEGLRFLRADGVAYRATATVTATSTTLAIPIEAEDEGAIGDCAAGLALTVASDETLPAGLNWSGVVAAGGLTGGSDQESIRALRRRAIDRRRKPPAGGSAADWERWAREASPKVDRVFVEPFVDDARAIWLQFTVTDQPDAIPSPAQLAAVQDYVASPLRRPLTARVFVTAPAASPVAITIGDLAASGDATRAAIAAELAASFRDEAEPGRPSAAFTLRRTVITGAIARVVGDNGFTLVAPTASLSFGAGVMPTLGAIAYV